MAKRVHDIASAFLVRRVQFIRGLFPRSLVASSDQHRSERLSLYSCTHSCFTQDHSPRWCRVEDSVWIRNVRKRISVRITPLETSSRPKTTSSAVGGAMPNATKSSQGLLELQQVADLILFAAWLFERSDTLPSFFIDHRQTRKCERKSLTHAHATCVDLTLALITDHFEGLRVPARAPCSQSSHCAFRCRRTSSCPECCRSHLDPTAPHPRSLHSRTRSTSEFPRAPALRAQDAAQLSRRCAERTCPNPPPNRHRLPSSLGLRVRRLYTYILAPGPRLGSRTRFQTRGALSTEPQPTIDTMIVAKESKLARDSVGQFPDPNAASSSSPIVMSPPPVEQQPIPNVSAAAAPPAYTPLPASGSSSGPAAMQPSPAPAGVSDRHPAPERHHARSASEYSGAEHEHSAARAFARGMLVIVMFPLIAFLGALYGVGKIIEGTGKGLAAGPESAYRSYKAREAREQEERRSKRAKPDYDA